MKKSLWTVLFKNTPASMPRDGKFADMTVYTFTVMATSADAAVDAFKLTRPYTVTKVSGAVLHRTRHYKVVKVFTGDGVARFKTYRGKMARKVVVLPSKMPKFLKYSFTGKGR